MHFRHNKLVILSLFALFSFGVLSLSTFGPKQFIVTLRDGQSLLIDSLFLPTQSEGLITKNAFPNLNAALIRSFDTDSNHIGHLKTYVNSVSQYRNLGYWSVLPAGDGTISDPTYSFPFDELSFDWKIIEGINGYWHRLFNNKVARTFLFNQSLDFVVALCKTYPADFKRRVLAELNELYTFSKNIPSISPKADILALKDYWKGFIFRRHHTNKIPLTEIQSSLQIAISKLNAIKEDNLPEGLYTVIINNQLSISYSAERMLVRSRATAKTLSFDAAWIDRVKYLTDNTGEYYQLTFLTAGGVSTSHLYTKQLEKIY